MATVTASSANRRRSAVRPGGSLRNKARAVRRFFAADAASACAACLAARTTSRKLAAGGGDFRCVACILKAPTTYQEGTRWRWR